jgi:peptidoglycan/LPS O-acetylase OafA/YrhL
VTAGGDVADRRGFRADVEGLRAVAVLAVVLYHAGVPGASGGFVGVDVFFVLSGFLITGLLWREACATGTVRLVRFYGARARRLLPAATLVLVAVVIAAAVLLPPLQARSVLGDAVASALYVGNYRLALRGTDYLAADSLPSPVQHYWSLGVEEQFYLLWPALLVLTAVAARAVCRRWPAGPQRPVPVGPAVLSLAAVTLASFAVSLAWTRFQPPWAYFSLATRAWELGVGGLVALTAAGWRRLPSWAAGVAGAGGLALVGLSCIRLGARTPYPGVAALAPVLGAALVIGAGCAPARWWSIGTALGTAPLRLVGRCSYSWYLWHWPVLVLAPVALGHPLGLAARLAAAGVSGALGVATTYAVENPVRFAAALRRSPARSLLVGGAATAVAVAAALVALLAVPVPVGRGTAADAPPLQAAPPSSAAAPPVDAHQAAVQALTGQVQAAVAASADIQAVPADLSPPLGAAAADKPDVFVNGCVRSWLYTGQGECASGDTASASTVALVGDSHAAMWEPAFQTLAAQRQWRLETLAKVTCPLMDLPITSPYLHREYTECEQWRGQIVARLHAEHPALVVLDMSRRYSPDYGFTVYDRPWLDGLTRLVADLRASGATVLVLGPVPDPRSTVPTCLSEHLDAATACAPDRAVAVNDAGIAAEEQATAAGGGRYEDLTSLFCTAGRCPVIVGNRLVFRDDNHVTVQYAQWLAPVVSALVDRAMARR